MALEKKDNVILHDYRFIGTGQYYVAVTGFYQRTSHEQYFPTAWCIFSRLQDPNVSRAVLYHSQELRLPIETIERMARVLG